MVKLSHEVVTPPYTFRPIQPDDAPGLYRLLQAIAEVEPNAYAPTLADVQSDLADPWMDLETDSRLALTGDSAVAARASFFANPQPVGEVRAVMDFDVHPAHNSDELEEALLDWLEARGTERVREIAAGDPGRQPLILRLLAWDTQRDLITRCERRGFRPVRYSYRMRRDLRQPIPDRPLLPGLIIRAYEPGLDERMRQARNESVSDSWSHEHVSHADWQQFFVQRSSFRPDLSFAVLDGDEVAAFSMNRFDPAEAERTGHRAGWIGSLGTRRAWRGRGLASALLVHSMRAFLAAGLEYAGLGVDSQNPTGALRLYEHLGFEPYARGITLHKVISANPPHVD